MTAGGSRPIMGAALLVDRDRLAGVERDSLNSYRGADDYHDIEVDVEEDEDELFAEILEDDRSPVEPPPRPRFDESS